MNLKTNDNTCVRIVDTDGNIYDGICQYYDAAYNEHEYDRDEDSLKIENFIFFQSDILEIHSLENHTGPYGKFLDPYGKLEEETIKEGMVFIEDVLMSEIDDHVMRLMNCLDKYLDPYFRYDLPYAKDIFALLHEIKEDHTRTEDIRNEAEHLINSYEPED